MEALGGAEERRAGEAARAGQVHEDLRDGHTETEVRSERLREFPFRTSVNLLLFFQGGRAQLHAVHVCEGGEEAERRPLRAGLDILPNVGHTGMHLHVMFL